MVWQRASCMMLRMQLYSAASPGDCQPLEGHCVLGTTGAMHLQQSAQQHLSPRCAKDQAKSLLLQCPPGFQGLSSSGEMYGLCCTSGIALAKSEAKQ